MTEPFDISPVFQRYRVSHHAVAMMLAAGLEPFEIERRTGFTRRRLTILQADPTFQELITYYAKREQEKFVPLIEEVEHLKAHNTLVANRQIRDRLEADDEAEVPRIAIRELIAIGGSTKTVDHKHSGSVDLNIAARLDRAIERSGKKPREIEHRSMEILEAQVVSREEAPQPRAVVSRPAPRPSFASVLRRPKVA
jgi:hypothetical protein